MRQREITQTQCEGPGCDTVTEEHMQAFDGSMDISVPSEWFTLMPNNDLGDYVYHCFCSLSCLRNYAQDKHETQRRAAHGTERAKHETPVTVQAGTTSEV